MQIGFENPESSGYFDAVSRINLYDLSVIAQGDENLFDRYFDTVPMALIEVCGEQMRLTRSNPAYRAFMERMLDMARLSRDFHGIDDPSEASFVRAFRQCCQKGERVAFDDPLPDGSTAHCFLRRIAEDASTGTLAVVVAVLAINEPQEGGIR